MNALSTFLTLIEVIKSNYFGYFSTSSSADSNDYSEVVKRGKYNPIEDASWKRGEKTPYLAFAKTLQAIEATR